jgi:hypothetical protein
LPAVFNTEKDLTEKIQNAILSTVNPGIEKFVAPHLSKLIDIVAYPVRVTQVLC